MSASEKSLQEKYAPQSICFGCGPANEKGLRIRSFDRGEWVEAEWSPEPQHRAFPGMLNGGVIGSLLDCHCNWTAAFALMKESGEDHPPCTVTAEYTIKLKRPTPSEQPVQLRAKATEIQGSKVRIQGELLSEGQVCATCEGLFVAVKPGHPAYHRW